MSDKRFNDAEQAQKAVHQITAGIPFGQPILVGHHSEKRARKDAEQIENGMRRAVQMWVSGGLAAAACAIARPHDRPR